MFQFLRPLLVLILVFTALTLIWVPAQIPPEPPEQLAERVSPLTTYSGPRSGGWATVRNRHVETHPRCEACGTDKELNVHHLQPFHVHPELELDPKNLITLCRAHHFWLGHRGDWSNENPNCFRDVKEYKHLHPWK
jgi:hypothetical protein